MLGKKQISETTNITNMELAFGAVLKLAQSLYSKGHIIYAYQFLTSPNLLQMLLQDILSGCGTVMIHRKEFPKEMIKPRVRRAVQCPKTGIVTTS